MKIIFLDVDGVLNNEDTFKHRREHYEKTGKWLVEIDDIMVRRLADIVNSTGAKIVLSSSWRKMFGKDMTPANESSQGLVDILHRYNLTILDRTGSSDTRQDEIDEWLKEHPEVNEFVILDDESFDLQKYIGTRLVKTSAVKDGEMVKSMSQVTGLQPEHVQQAIKILKEEQINH